MKSFLTKLFGRFVTVEAIRNADDIFTLDYSQDYQLAGQLQSIQINKADIIVIVPEKWEANRDMSIFPFFSISSTK